MSTQPKRPVSDILHGLMYSTGALLLFGAVPLGIAMALNCRYKYDEPVGNAVYLGVAMGVSTGVVGGVLLLLAMLITKLRHRR